MHDFRKLRVWERGRTFGREVYLLTARARAEQRVVTAQLRRSALAIAPQIAEGCGKRTRAESIRYFDMARGSCCESESHLETAKDLGIVPAREAHRLISEVVQLQRMLQALMRNLPDDSDAELTLAD